MAIDLQAALRRVNWHANKRTLMAAHRLPPAQLAEAQALHGSGAYEGCLQCVTGAKDWQSDPRAWRLVGLCQLGLRDYAAAQQAFEQARFLNGLEVAKDEVNIATAHIAASNYERGLEAAQRALRIAPFLAGPHVCILSIYNRTGRREDLVDFLADLLATNREVADDPDFLERVANDTDLIGVGEIIASLREARA